jgi:hypothetical protein
MLQIVSFVFHLPKGCSTKSMQFENELFLGLVRRNKYIRLFANANLIANRFDNVSHRQCFQRQEVIAQNSQPIALDL